MLSSGFHLLVQILIFKWLWRGEKKAVVGSLVHELPKQMSRKGYLKIGSNLLKIEHSFKGVLEMFVFNVFKYDSLYLKIFHHSEQNLAKSFTSGECHIIHSLVVTQYIQV